MTRKDFYKNIPVKADEITPEDVYLNRRQFMKAAGVIGAGVLLAACGEVGPETAAPQSPAGGSTAMQETEGAGGSLPQTDEYGDPLNSFEEITNYNNFYEFSLDKERVAPLSEDFQTSPWKIKIDGLVNKPMTVGMEDILANYAQEDRIYRLRCVEGWSMVIPWQGFPLAKLLEAVEPTSDAKFIGFQTIDAPEQMPGMSNPGFPWPYTEGLRLDEAMHNLTILATGLYGKPMPSQNGAPIRLVVPWKYGFKSIKSIVKIDLLAEQPATFWNTTAPNEYGFYSNVNPDKPHPRWSQATERRIGEVGRRETLMFNGYAGDVADLYEGMDLNVYF